MPPRRRNADIPASRARCFLPRTLLVASGFKCIIGICNIKPALAGEQQPGRGGIQTVLCIFRTLRPGPVCQAVHAEVCFVGREHRRRVGLRQARPLLCRTPEPHHLLGLALHSDANDIIAQIFIPTAIAYVVDKAQAILALIRGQSNLIHKIGGPLLRQHARRRQFLHMEEQAVRLDIIHGIRAGSRPLVTAQASAPAVFFQHPR